MSQILYVLVIKHLEQPSRNPSWGSAANQQRGWRWFWKETLLSICLWWGRRKDVSYCLFRGNVSARRQRYVCHICQHLEAQTVFGFPTTGREEHQKHAQFENSQRTEQQKRTSFTNTHFTSFWWPLGARELPNLPLPISSLPFLCTTHFLSNFFFSFTHSHTYGETQQ